jgi:WD40 repeat protein
MKMKTNILLFTLFFTSLLFSCRSAAQQIKRTVKETPLLTVNDSALVNRSYVFTNDMRKVACCVRDGKKQRVLVNGFKGNAYDSVCNPVFSPDGNSFMYRALQDKHWLWITADDKEFKTEKNDSIIFVRYSPNNRDIAYVAASDKGLAMVFNGTRSRLYDHIDDNSIVFSKDGKKIYYTAVLKNKMFIVADNREGIPYDQVGFPVLSSDDNRLAYWAINGKNYYVVVDGKISKPYERAGPVIFGNGGKHYAFTAMLDGKHIVVFDGVQSEKYIFVHTLLFSPDGNRLAYALEATELGKDGFNHYISLDGKKSELYETVVEESLKFSADSKILAFEAEIHDAFFIVANGKESKHYSDVLQTTVVFSEDDRRIAFAAEDDTKRFVVVDQVEGQPYQDVFHIVFSPDGERVVYSAKLDNKELVVVHGINGVSYDELPGLGMIHFESPDSFYYLARKGDRILLVEEKIENK